MEIQPESYGKPRRFFLALFLISVIVFLILAYFATFGQKALLSLLPTPTPNLTQTSLAFVTEETPTPISTFTSTRTPTRMSTLTAQVQIQTPTRISTFTSASQVSIPTPTGTQSLGPTPTSTPYPTNTPYPTYSPYPTYTPYPTYSPEPTVPPTSTPIIPEEIMELSGWAIGAVTSCITSILALVGFVSTTMLTWKKERRDADKTRLDYQRALLEIEKMRDEMEKNRYK